MGTPGGTGFSLWAFGTSADAVGVLFGVPQRDVLRGDIFVFQRRDGHRERTDSSIESRVRGRLRVDA
jgi:hypothetical protein